MSKHGPTSNCSAAFADITGWTAGGTISAIGFDVRKGSACGAGAPRINLYSGATTYSFGCFHGTKTAAPQDPANWDRITFNAAGAPVGGYPGAETFVFGVTPVDQIQIIFDEGTDTPTLPDNPAGIGLAVIDNVRINNTVITRRKGNVITPEGVLVRFVRAGCCAPPFFVPRRLARSRPRRYDRRSVASDRCTQKDRHKMATRP